MENQAVSWYDILARAQTWDEIIRAHGTGDTGDTDWYDATLTDAYDAVSRSGNDMTVLEWSTDCGDVTQYVLHKNGQKLLSRLARVGIGASASLHIDWDADFPVKGVKVK